MQKNHFYFWSLMAISLLFACNSNEHSDTNAENQTASKSAAPAPLPKYFYKQMKGSINGNLPITLNITREDTLITGSYFYDKKKQAISISGSIQADDVVKITEYADVVTKDGIESKETGHFEGKWKGDEFSGTWKNEKNAFPFILKESYPTGAAKLEAKYYHKDYKHKIKDGEVGANIEYLVFQVVDCGNEAAKAAINAAILDELLLEYQGEDEKPKKVESIDKLMTNFIDNYKADIKEFEKDGELAENFNYEENSSYTVAMNQNNMLSLARNIYGYMGGAHGSSDLSYSNYDLRTGQKIKLADIFVPAYSEKLNTIAEKYFREQNGIGPKTPWQEAGYDFENQKFALNDNFAIQADGITFQFGQYEIAAYAVGMPSVTIPYSALQGLLKKDSPVSAFSK